MSAPLWTPILLGVLAECTSHDWPRGRASFALHPFLLLFSSLFLRALRAFPLSSCVYWAPASPSSSLSFSICFLCPCVLTGLSILQIVNGRVAMLAVAWFAVTEKLFDSAIVNSIPFLPKTGEVPESEPPPRGWR